MLPVRDNIRTRTAPLVVLVLAALCVAVFLKEVHLQRTTPVRAWRDIERSSAGLDALLARCALIPERVADGALRPGELVAHPIDALRVVALPLLTSLFLHGGVAHLVSNLWFLWVFGRTVEARLGGFRFLALYLFAGVLAGLGHVFFLTLSRSVDSYAAVYGLPLDSYADRLRIVANDVVFQRSLEPYEPSRVPTIGASGAIAGVLGAYAVLFPRARMVTILPPLFFLPFEVPALLFIGLWLASQIFGLWDVLDQDLFHGLEGIAYGAHFAGFAAGLLLALWLRPTPPRSSASAAAIP